MTYDMTYERSKYALQQQKMTFKNYGNYKRFHKKRRKKFLTAILHQSLYVAINDGQFPQRKLEKYGSTEDDKNNIDGSSKQ